MILSALICQLQQQVQTEQCNRAYVCVFVHVVHVWVCVCVCVYGTEHAESSAGERAWEKVERDCGLMVPYVWNSGENTAALVERGGFRKPGCSSGRAHLLPGATFPGLPASGGGSL